MKNSEKSRVTHDFKPINSARDLIIEAEVAEGLEQVAREEIVRRLRNQCRLHVPNERWGRKTLRFSYAGDPRLLQQLQTVQAVYLVQRFDVPRPRALLGDQHFRLLLSHIAFVQSLSPQESFRSFFVSAAGSESSVMRRLRDMLAEKTRLVDADEKGDLLLRVLPALETGSGWDVLIRLTPRPLATRAWRVANYEGALNATVAQAMISLTRPQSNELYVNLGCGSGTLLIERAAAGNAGQIVGIDHDPEVLGLAETNIAASGFGHRIALLVGDARALSFTDASVDNLTADLPFGQSVGSHRDNLTLYPQLLKEAARVAKPHARFVVITHEVHLMEQLLERSGLWNVEYIQRVTLRGLHPRIYVLKRNAG